MKICATFCQCFDKTFHTYWLTNYHLFKHLSNYTNRVNNRTFMLDSSDA